MFEEAIRALRQLEGQTQISVPIGDGDEGHSDQECQFKIFGQGAAQ
jgi:hypothetical protein